MKKITTLLPLTLCINAFASPTSEDLKNCDLLYSAQATSYEASVACYVNLFSKASTATDQKVIYERAFITLSSIVNGFPKTDRENGAISQALNLLSKMEKDLGSSADYAYWFAVFTSFNAVMQDRGGILPRHMFGVMRSIQENLNTAISLDPTLHGYGPKRVLGIMHTQMPGIVGGDKTLAETLLADAYAGAPQFSANQVAYAKILSVNGKDDEAKAVIQKFLAQADAAFNPYPNEPLRAPSAELARDRQTAKQILDQIEENE